jgi:2-dehydro-3-deoxy-L-rhamnonate dehydrogenase (NAD+)
MSKEVAVVTGGASGIGYAIAARLLSEGKHVCIWDMNAQGMAKAAASLGNAGVSTERVDITDAAGVETAAGQTEARDGPIAILVHSAGIAGPSHPVVSYPIADWKQVVDIDLNGTFYVNQAIVKRMIPRNYGRIVNIASIAGKEGNPNAAPYSAAKAGVIAFTKSLGKETAQYDIAVNCITPAAAKTPIFDQISQAHIDFMLSKIPRGRFVKVEEIAAMVSFLVSKENSFTTGAVFDLSGGRATY